jgi:hypothetical protein
MVVVYNTRLRNGALIVCTLAGAFFRFLRDYGVEGGHTPSTLGMGTVMG